MQYRNLTPLLRRALIIGGLALVVVVATIAITHQTGPAPLAQSANSALPGNPEPVSRDLAYQPSTSPASNPPVVAAVSPFGPGEAVPPPPAVSPQPVPVTAEVAPMYGAPIVETAAVRRRTVARRTYYRSRVRRRRNRPFSHSVAIVGGSAAGGAIVGGLVGGGKGAGIGALAGGAGGLIYDRATHKRKH